MDQQSSLSSCKPPDLAGSSARSLFRRVFWALRLQPTAFRLFGQTRKVPADPRLSRAGRGCHTPGISPATGLKLEVKSHLGIVGATVEQITATRFALGDIPVAARRALHSFDEVLLDVFALGVASCRRQTRHIGRCAAPAALSTWGISRPGVAALSAAAWRSACAWSCRADLRCSPGKP